MDPKTAAGKAAISQNARRHGLRSADWTYICAVLGRQRQFVRGVMDEHKRLNRKRKLAPKSKSREQTDMNRAGGTHVTSPVPAGPITPMGASSGKEPIMFENPPLKLPSFTEQSESIG